MRLNPTLLCACVLLMGAAVCDAGASPRAPTNPDEVLQRLPKRVGPRPARIAPPPAAALPAGAHTSKPELAHSLVAAEKAIAQARLNGDPREWGQAEALLAPWWQDAQIPSAALLLRATVRQGQHDFAGALADLDLLLARPQASVAPTLRGQAELTRASLHQVQGRYAQAREGCERIGAGGRVRPDPQLLGARTACLAELDQLQGRRDGHAVDRLLTTIDAADGRWVSTLRAELAQREGWTANAGARYREATAGPSPSVYALAAHADWLLEQRQPRGALALLAEAGDADALALRRVIALRRLHPEGRHASGWTDAARELQARFDAALARGDRSHARELARFELDVRGDAVAALAWAQENWTWQREPADALLLMRCAHALQRPEAAEPVRQWARGQGFVDQRWRAFEQRAAPEARVSQAAVRVHTRRATHLSQVAFHTQEAK